MKPPTTTLLEHLRRLTCPPAADAVLLDRWVHQRDEQAFAALVARHGPMVLGVCQRILGDAHEAEDALQATFLILARKAASLRQPEALACWLHGVAARLAHKSRTAARRRAGHSRTLATEPADSQLDPLALLTVREMLGLIDEEIRALREAYRLPVVLCDLEGRTQEEAAGLLGWTLGSLRGRLLRGRAQLKARLERRGLTLPAGIALPLVPAALSASLSAAGPVVTPQLVATVTQAAVRFSMDSVAAQLSGPAVDLAREGLRILMLTKVKIAAAAVLTMTVFVAGAGLLGRQVWQAKPAEERREDKTPPAAPHPPLPQFGGGEGGGPAAEKPQVRLDRFGDPLLPGALARLGTMRLRHSGWVTSVAYSLNGKLLASAGWDERVRLWDAETGKELRHFDLVRKGQGASPVNGVAFSPDGKFLAAGGWGTGLALWDVASGKEIRREQGVTRYVVFSPDSRTVVTGGLPNQGAGLLDLQSNKRRGILLDGATIHAVAFSPDGKLLATAGPKNRVSLWDAATLKERRSCQGHEGEVRSLDFAPDSKQLVSGGMDKTVRLWDVVNGKEIRCFQAAGLVDGVRYCPDGKTIAARSDGRAILLWDAKSGKKLRQFAGHGGDFSFPMAFSPDGKKLLAAQGNTLQVWETATGKELFPASGIRESIDNFAYSGDGRTLATVSWDGMIRLWETATYREVRRFGGQQPGTRSLAFSANGQLVATAGQDKTTRLWDAATGKELFCWDTDLNDGFHLAFTPDGQMLASGNGDGSIQLWRTSTGKPLRRLKGHSKGPVYDVVFSPDGQTLLSAARDKTVRLWDWDAGKEIRAFTGHTGWVMAAAFAPNGRTAASAGDSNDLFIRLWDVKTAKELRRFEGHEPGLNTGIFSIAFSPDGRMLASAGFGDTIPLWEVATGKERCRFHGQDYRIAKVAFSPDGRVLASAGTDGTILLWDATGRDLDGWPRRQRLTRQEWETCWRKLADRDARRAYRALQALAADPEQSVARLKERVRAVTAADAKRTARLIRELDSDDFAVRTTAEEELAKQGASVPATLEQTLKGEPSLEQRKRIERVLERLERERVTLGRALEVLEHAHTPESRQLLETLAAGEPNAWLTQEAKAARQRR